MNHSPLTRPPARRGSWWIAALALAAALHGRTHASPPDAPRPPAGALMQSLPLAFVPNLGQSDPAVRFQAKSLGGAVFFTPSEVVLALPQSRAGSPESRRHRAGDPREMALGSDEGVPVKFVRIRLIGSAPTAAVAGATLLPGSSHEFIGSDPRRWRANLPTYAGVVYR